MATLTAQSLATLRTYRFRSRGCLLHGAVLRAARTIRPGRCQLQVRAASSNGASPSHDGSSYDYDLFTIGAGSGGVRASRFAASNYGAKVGICELPFARVSSEKLGGAGGTCVLRGCVPKKLMVIGGEFSDAFRDSMGFGWETLGNGTLPEVAWDRFMERKNKELDRLNGIYMKLLDGAGVDYHEGRGKIIDAHTLEVDGKHFTAKHILVATGARAWRLPIEGSELTLTSDEILDLEKLPKKLAIIGAGYIALEFASIYNNYGTDVHVFYRQELPLRGFDEECRQFMFDQYKLRGLNLHATNSPTKVAKGEDGKLTLWTKDKSGKETVTEGLDHVLMATGRHPNTNNLGLEEAGVDKDEKSGAIKVNEYSQTSVPSIWAIGDVTDRIALTPVALMEGMALAKNVFGGDSAAKPDYENVASAVFSSPPLASVGLTEEGALAEHGNIDVFTSSFRPMKATIGGGEGKAFMKLIVAADTDKVVGVHMIGPECAEIMQGLAVAVKMGVTKAQLDTVVGIHPSSAEEFVTMRSPARQLREKAAPQKTEQNPELAAVPPKPY